MSNMTKLSIADIKKLKETVDSEHGHQPNFLDRLKQIINKEVIPEYRFHPTRKWRFDYAIPEFKIAIEIDGGVFIQGRHNRGSGYVKDMEKFNEAAILGWRILRFTPQQIKKEQWIETIKRTINRRSI